MAENIRKPAILVKQMTKMFGKNRMISEKRAQNLEKMIFFHFFDSFLLTDRGK